MHFSQTFIAKLFSGLSNLCFIVPTRNKNIFKQYSIGDLKEAVVELAPTFIHLCLLVQSAVKAV